VARKEWNAQIGTGAVTPFFTRESSPRRGLGLLPRVKRSRTRGTARPLVSPRRGEGVVTDMYVPIPLHMVYSAEPRGCR
jgi:hypothetical protein